MAERRRMHDESFHRLELLRPRLRVSVGVTRQRYRGVRWRVLHDAASNRHARLTESAYAFVGMLNGRRTVGETMAACRERLGDAAPTESEAVKLLTQLWSADLLVGDAPPDPAMVARRGRRRRQRETQSRLASFLFVRIPLFDPYRILRALAPFARPLYSSVGLLGWGALIAIGGWAVVTHLPAFRNSTAGVLSPSNLPWLAAVFIVTKLIHEFGHGLACTVLTGRERAPVGSRRARGEVHEMGVMLLVLLPVPYVDASAAWAIRSKWRRVLVNAAGMHAELATASVAALLFVSSTPGSLVHALSYNAVFIAGVTTLLFNANPLLRYDGYYILADAIEQPNLSTRSRDAVRALVRRVAFGVRRAHDSARDAGERAVLLTYGVLAGMYKLFIAAVIVWFVSGQFFVLGVLLAAGAVVTMVLVPIGKFIGYLASNAELDGRRTRALAATAIVVVTLAAAIGTAPAPDRVALPGVVVAPSEQVVTPRAPGWVVSAPEEGDALAAGDLVIELRNDDLLAERGRLRAQLRAERVRRNAALDAGDATSAAAHATRVDTIDEALERTQRDIDSLAVVASHDGIWRTNHRDLAPGRFVDAGTELGRLMANDRLRVSAIVQQRQAALVNQRVARNVTVRRANGDVIDDAALRAVSESSRRELPSAALAFEAGGSVRARRVDDNAAEAAEPFFEANIELTREPGILLGERVWVRVERDPRPIASQLLLTIRQAFQRRASGTATAPTESAP
jgi:putative peptide zinc metalloprotease protein